MSSLRHIRKTVLGLSQSEFAAIAGVSQGTVSKWEADELNPNRDEMVRIRDEAHRRGVEWSDSWFFELPSEVSQ
jgi:transcriptional regulator with XRE-family HTH domain